MTPPDLNHLHNLACEIERAPLRVGGCVISDFAGDVAKLIDWLQLNASQAPPASTVDIAKVREQMASFEISTKSWLWHTLAEALAELETLRAALSPTVSRDALDLAMSVLGDGPAPRAAAVALARYIAGDGPAPFNGINLDGALLLATALLDLLRAPPVTAVTITDEQIIALRKCESPITGNVAYACSVALDKKETVERSQAARERCAEAWNRIQGGKP